MPSLESTNIRATPRAVDGVEPVRLRSQPTLTDSQCTSSEAFGYQRAAVSTSGTGRRAHRHRHVPAFEAIARRLRRACAHSARAWALAAGVPPDLTGEWLAALIEDPANTEDQPLQR
jgi:hypothetical protein